ncbi:MAG: mucoidy inhibitor MuiA family protein [Myxococcaceae bacterium]
MKVELPLVKVTVLEDRALCERGGTVQLPAGTSRLTISGLAPVAVDRSLQVSVSQGTVHEARVSRSWHKKDERPEALTDLEQRLRALQREMKATTASVERADLRVQLAHQARADVVRAISESAGAPPNAPGANRSTWKEQLELSNKAVEEAEERARLARQEVKRVQKRAEEAALAARTTQAPDQRLITSAELTVEHTGGTAQLTIRYLVPCAVWRPAYRATLSSANDSVAIEAEAVVWQRTGEEWKDVALSFSTARPTLGANPPRLTEDWLSLRDKTQQERQQVDVSIREEEIQTTGEGGAAQVSEVPGVDDGGETLSLAAPHKVTVPSDGAAHRVPLFRFLAPAESELVATPELSPLVQRIARFENKGNAPLLAGPVELVRTSGYVGRGQLKFAARGEKVKLSFGSEDVLRVARSEQTDLDTAMLTGKRTTTHSVKLFVSNTGSEPVKLSIEERIPVSEVEQVDVKVLREKSRPAPNAPNADGIVRYQIDAGARSQQELLFVWSTTASAKVAGM